MTLPSISIIVPVYNDQEGVLNLLRYLAKQSKYLDATEIVIVDNASVPSININNNDHPNLNVKSFICEKPGSYAARNLGAKKATGELLVFIDADCWPHPNWLEHGVQAMNENKKIIGGEVEIIKAEQPTAVALYQYLTGFDQENNIASKNFSATANLFCTRAQFDSIGPFSEELLSGGDREWCWRAIKNNFPIEYAPLAVVFTMPRESLRAAIRQARRVAGGRKMLADLSLTHVGEKSLEKKRSAAQSIVWIIKHPEINFINKIKIITIAGVIRIAESVEKVRMKLGLKPERR